MLRLLPHILLFQLFIKLHFLGVVFYHYVTCVMNIESGFYFLFDHLRFGLIISEIIWRLMSRINRFQKCGVVRELCHFRGCDWWRQSFAVSPSPEPWAHYTLMDIFFRVTECWWRFPQGHSPREALAHYTLKNIFIFHSNWFWWMFLHDLSFLEALAHPTLKYIYFSE